MTGNFAFRSWMYIDARNFYRIRNLMRRIAVHHWKLDAMAGRNPEFGRGAFIAAEFRASHKNVDILCEADNICAAIGAVSAAVREDKGIYILPRRYNLDNVSLHADLYENEFERMISAFEEHVSCFGITGDSEYIADSVQESESIAPDVILH